MAIHRPLIALVALLSIISSGESKNTNNVFSPCGDASVQRSDGFTFGVAFAQTRAFSFNGTQLSPCDSRLSLTGSSQVAVFRPKVDEISLLTINTSTFQPDSVGGYMVAFAGRKYAARSMPAFVANSTYIVTSFTLNSRRGGFKTCTGKETDVLRARATQASYASTIKTVPSESTTAKTEVGMWTAASGYSWRFLARISTNRFSIPGTRFRIFDSTHSSTCTPISEILSLVNTTVSSNCASLVCRFSFLLCCNSVLFKCVNQTPLISLYFFFRV
ncbi:hypothetical protein MIMGU_mgv1a011713mg [Erythranthe guttata]|uniref:Uncharacterized protein n=1 Tax=Erythranthe guttata TaxID=4155 RepID=A0A022PPB2_ERYGU|nr:hypothetical protein MIMGU_mgv1a011713mg [Erythranthe guttata]